MKLQKIIIENFKCIEKIEFDIFEANGSHTYSLLGINESGKSSFLKAVSLIESQNLVYPSDFYDDSLPVSISYTYALEKKDLEEIFTFLNTNHGFETVFFKKIEIEKIDLITQFKADTNVEIEDSQIIHFKNNIFPEYTLKANVLTKKGPSEKDLEDLNLTPFFNKVFETFFWEKIHSIVFWKPSPEYLLLESINLLQFAANPESISIPLLNCFVLSGIKKTNIKHEIDKLNSPANINSLQSRLSDTTTSYIRNVWPEHPISITFQITNNTISLLIEDDEIKYKPKTASQRSDGFKQFISFLLTVSIENHTEGLSKTILLIDEPETHLHPPAQINLLKELIKITSNKNDNIVFFATHSNYLIDKENLDRNFIVKKEGNLKTTLKRIEKKSSTYAEVNFEVFGILTSDYHNELYGYIEAEDKSTLDTIDKIKKWIDSRNIKERTVSLPEYIRHSIHHPENKLNKKFTEKELLDSINILRKIKDGIA